MIDKINEQYTLEYLQRAKAKREYEANSLAGASDEANFSAFSVELARVSGELKSVPEVRQDIIDDLKEKVEAGKYRPPLEKVAYSLFMAGILNSGE